MSIRQATTHYFLKQFLEYVSDFLRSSKIYIRTQRKFIDRKKTKLFRFRWNWAEEKKLLGIRLQISSLTSWTGVVIL
jgi:hypothetical protein